MHYWIKEMLLKHKQYPFFPREELVQYSGLREVTFPSSQPW